MSQIKNENPAEQPRESTAAPRSKKSNLWQVLQSVLAAFFGVQTKAKFDHDAGQADYKSYLVVGLIMTILFVVCLAYFVKWLVGDITAGL